MIKNTLFCEPKNYKHFLREEVQRSLRRKLRAERFQVIAESYCELDRAYLLDQNGKVHTIIIEGGE